MFRRVEGGDPEAAVPFEFEGCQLRTERGATLAAALLENGIAAWRTSPVGGGARAPFCMIGACFECLVIVEGRGQVQACLVEVTSGMRVCRPPTLAGSGAGS